MNHVTLLGRLGHEPELRHTQSGKAVCNIRIAVNDGKDRPPVWVPVVCWERTAELVHQYKRKGDEVVIEGRLSIRDYTDKDGNERKATEVQAHRVHFVSGGKRDEQRPAPSGGGYGGRSGGGGGYGGGWNANNDQMSNDDDIVF